MKIAVQGLGRMGMQIARKLVEDGHDVIVHNRSREPVDEAVKYGAVAAYTKEEVVAAFGSEPVILWIMLPASIVDDQLDQWLTIIPEGSILIDGGNSDYRLTKQRNQTVTDRKSILVDVGTSGGVWGYQNGFSMMIGCDTDSTIKRLEPAFHSLAQPAGAFRYFGPSGSGHFVKMTHNAIEYGFMESLAEGYRILKDGPYTGLDLSAAAEVWQHHSVITSWLNELCQDVLQDNPELDGIDGYVAESGEARWALETAKDTGIPTPSIQAAFDVRIASQQGNTNFGTKLIAAMRNKFGGHELNK